ncbi:hypothetical protein [Nonomuraea endophytica]|uniref:hypothetical protein n=1 Tax=Nonomuraea endophytica TaxID=714136 RepID=UPI0037C5460C
MAADVHQAFGVGVAAGDHVADGREYGPANASLTFTAATTLEAAYLERIVPLLLLTPVEIFRAVLPEMIERGDGAVLMTTGATAIQPMPYLSGPGVVMAAARAYLHTLNGELADKGVYAGTLCVAALIDRSEAAEDHTFDGQQLPIADPDHLADIYWDMYTRRDRIEQVHPAWPGQ